MLSHVGQGFAAACIGLALAGAVSTAQAGNCSVGNHGDTRLETMGYGDIWAYSDDDIRIRYDGWSGFGNIWDAVASGRITVTIRSNAAALNHAFNLTDKTSDGWQLRGITDTDVCPGREVRIFCFVYAPSNRFSVGSGRLGCQLSTF